MAIQAVGFASIPNSMISSFNRFQYNGNCWFSSKYVENKNSSSYLPIAAKADLKAIDIKTNSNMSPTNVESKCCTKTSEAVKLYGD